MQARETVAVETSDSPMLEKCHGFTIDHSLDHLIKPMTRAEVWEVYGSWAKKDNVAPTDALAETTSADRV